MIVEIRIRTSKGDNEIKAEYYGTIADIVRVLDKLIIAAETMENETQS